MTLQSFLFPELDERLCSEALTAAILDKLYIARSVERLFKLGTVHLHLNKHPERLSRNEVKVLNEPEISWNFDLDNV